MSSGSDDEEEEEGGWLSQSTFSLAPPPVSARHRSTDAERRPLSLRTHGFDASSLFLHTCHSLLRRDKQDSFGSSSSTGHEMSEDDPFNPKTNVRAFSFPL